MPNDKDKDASSPSSLRCLVPSDHSWGQNPVWAFERYASGNLDRFGRPFFRIGKSSMHLFASFNMFQQLLVLEQRCPSQLLGRSGPPSIYITDALQDCLQGRSRHLLTVTWSLWFPVPGSLHGGLRVYGPSMSIDVH